MATHCNHPSDRLSLSGISTEDYAVGSRWPVKVYWYTCGVCGDEFPGAETGTERMKTESDNPPEHDPNEPF